MLPAADPGATPAGADGVAALVSEVSVRPATAADAEACRAIYEPYVRETAVSFETEVPTTQQVAGRIAHAHVWLVAERDGEVIGYAYASEHRQRAAYRWTCETSVYVERGALRGGVGRALYRELLVRVRERGYRLALAGVALPNPASIGLHRSLGFVDVGVFHRIGWKLGAWHDVAWLELDLAPETEGDTGTVAPPRR